MINIYYFTIVRKYNTPELNGIIMLVYVVLNESLMIQHRGLLVLTTATPDWSFELKLLRILGHDDLYKTPR